MDPPYWPLRHQTEENAEGGEKILRQAHGQRHIPRFGPAAVIGILAEKDRTEKFDKRGERDGGDEYGHQSQEDKKGLAEATAQRRLIDQPFAGEAAERGDAGNRERRDDRGRGSNGHDADQTADLVDVPGAGLVKKRPGVEKKA